MAFGPDAKRLSSIGSTNMKKILIVAAAAGLMSLAACEGGTTNTAENAGAAAEANASIYDEGATNDANAVAENVLDNATVVEGNVADAAPANAH
jgi:hypothetical protein